MDRILEEGSNSVWGSIACGLRVEASVEANNCCYHSVSTHAGPAVEKKRE